MTDYDKLRQLAENATPGPWESELEENPGTWDALVYTTLGGERVVAQEMFDADAEFIAAANPQAILNLLEDLRITRAERDQTKHDCLVYRKENAALRRGQGRAAC